MLIIRSRLLAESQRAGVSDCRDAMMCEIDEFTGLGAKSDRRVAIQWDEAFAERLAEPILRTFENGTPRDVPPCTVILDDPSVKIKK